MQMSLEGMKEVSLQRILHSYDGGDEDTAESDVSSQCVDLLRHYIVVILVHSLFVAFACCLVDVSQSWSENDNHPNHPSGHE